MSRARGNSQRNDVVRRNRRQSIDICTITEFTRVVSSPARSRQSAENTGVKTARTNCIGIGNTSRDANGEIAIGGRAVPQLTQGILSPAQRLRDNERSNCACVIVARADLRDDVQTRGNDGRRAGGVAVVPSWPKLLLPQQTTELFERIAHV